MERDEIGELKALVETMFLVASVDGDFSIAERRHFLDMVTSLSAGRLGSTELLDYLEEVRVRLFEEGRARRLVALRQELRDETGRRLAYGLATQVALVDGMVDSEKLLLDEMAAAFELSEEENEEIAQSVAFSSRRPPD